jgi:DHA1 family bicyclomycin/chloramphenicol resistance-like MFS transporter
LTGTAPAGGRPGTGVAGFVVLVSISALGPLGINMIVPSLPGLGRDLGVDYGVAQLAFSVFPFSMAFFIVLTGPLADIFGRRPVLFAGLGAYVLATLAAALAPNIESVIAARIIQAAGAGAGIVVGRASIGDLYERDRAASMMGYVTMGYGVAPMFAPMIGGVLEEVYGWRMTFGFLFLLGSVVLVASWKVLPETSRVRGPGEARPSFLGAIAELAVAPAFWAIALTNAFNSSVYFTFLGGGSFVGEHVLGLSPGVYGGYLMLVVAGYIAGNWFTGRYTVRLGPMRLMIAGCLLLIAVALVMLVADVAGALSPLTLFGPTVFMGFGNGLITPNCLALAISVRPRLAGTAVGFASGIQLGFAGLMSTVVGWWIAHDQSAFPLMAQLTAMAVLTLVFTLLSRRLLRGTGGLSPTEDGR